MISKDSILETLPPFKNEWKLLEDRQNTDDIRQAILVKHAETASDYDRFSDMFYADNIIDASREIFDFLKYNVPYTKESDKYQTVKNPYAILTDGETVDCKNYSLFIAGTLDSLKRNYGGKWDWHYRFASYDKNEKRPGHVFVVVVIQGKELWIDPVFDFFNAGEMHEWEINQKPQPVTSIGGLYSISGPDAANQGTVTVNAADAARKFLVAVNLDLYGLKDLLNSDPGILYGPVYNVCRENGVDFNTLLILLNQN
jgi:hypothetical protein